MISIITLSLVLFLAYRLFLIIYRLYFHPLKDFPGPTLAKCTRMWEFYKEVRGTMTQEFHSELVPKYGNAVRVGPNRIRIKDPAAFHIIHAARSEFKKDPYMYDSIGRDAMSVTTNIEKHNLKRKILDPMFSKKNIVANFESLVQSRCQDMLNLIRDYNLEHANTALRAERVFAVMMGEVASQVAFGDSVGLRDKEKFLSHDLLLANEAQWKALPFLKLMPWINIIMFKAPKSVLALLGPVAAASAAIEEMVEGHVRRIVKLVAEGKKLDDNAHSLETLIHTIPGRNEKEIKELVDDGMNQFIAGFHTTTWAASVGAYYLAKEPELQDRLRREVLEAKKAYDRDGGDGHLPYSVLEKLPYLTGVVKESLRLSYGIAGTLSRIVPHGGRHLAGHFIPAGTALELDGYGILSEPSIYASPSLFQPERWDPAQTPPETIQKQEHNLIVFSRGNYNCIGQYLAVLDLYVCLARTVETFELRLDEELEKEGFLWEERFATVKKGRPILIYFQERG